MEQPTARKASCVELINSGIYLNNTRGKNGKKERDLQCDLLLKKFFYDCDFESTKSRVISMVFSDTITTLVQAVESYRYGQFDASMVMIRNAIDASTYISIVYELNYNMASNRIISVQPKDGVTEYKKFKDWCKRSVEITKRGFLTFDELKKLCEIKQESNFSAHYFEIKRDKFHDYIKAIAELRRPKPDLPKQYTTEFEVKNALNAVVDILMSLHENYVRYYQIPL